MSVASFVMSEIQTREECDAMLTRVRARSGNIEGNTWDVSLSDHGVVLSGLYSGEIVEVGQACFEEILLGWLSVFRAR